MSQLTDNLNAIASIKSDIAAAIESKGVSMTGVPFGSYADKIGEITTSFVTEPLNVTDNGVYNPGQGVDGYSQVTVNVPQSVTGFTEKDLTEGQVTIVNLSNSASFVAVRAFNNNTTIRTVNLPNCVSVSDYAFGNCGGIQSVDLPNCTTISGSAFSWCSSLQQISIPNCVSLGSDAFVDCRTLPSIDIPNVSILYNGAFARCYSLSSISAPKVTECRQVVFTQDGNLRSIDLPLCRSIGDMTFSYCNNLVTVNIPKCEYIGYAAFAYCSSLTEVNFPKLRSTSNNVFSSCSSLSKISIPECYLIGSSAFYNCDITGRLELPNCFIISNYAFQNNEKITEISAPYVVSMSGWTFTNGYNATTLQLSVIDFPNLVFMGQAFYSVEGITKVNFPLLYYPSYGAQQNWNCSSLTEMSVGNRTYVVPSWTNNLYTFWISGIEANNGSIYVDATMYDKWVSANGWSSYSSYFSIEGDSTVPMLSLSDGLLYGKTEAMYNYWWSNNWQGINVNSSVVTTVSLPECRVIDSRAFQSIGSLRSVYIPNCNYIGQSAFRQCGISVIDLPKCRYIENNAFTYCYQLKSIILRESTICYLGYDLIIGTIGLSIFVPSSLVEDYKRIYLSSASYFYPIPE